MFKLALIVGSEPVVKRRIVEKVIPLHVKDNHPLILNKDKKLQTALDNRKFDRAIRASRKKTFGIKYEYKKHNRRELGVLKMKQEEMLDKFYGDDAYLREIMEPIWM